MSNPNSYPESPQEPVNASSYIAPQKRNVTFYYYIGAFCAFISLILLPEIFGGVAIVLGAYCWRLEYGENRNRGIWLILLALVTMFIGLYYTSYFALYDILP